jgi:hypothetical protein
MKMYHAMTLILLAFIVGCTPQSAATPLALEPSAPAAEPTIEAATDLEAPTMDEDAMDETPTQMVETSKPEGMQQEPGEITDDCGLEPIVVPTIPEDIPPYTGLDESTGLHVTGTALEVDLRTYRLKVMGLVDNPLSLTYDELRCMSKVTATPTLVCEGFFVDVATWSGVPLADILEKAGVQDGATQVVLISADGYQTTIDLNEAMKPINFLAYELEGEPVPVLHGFPLRAVFPDLTGFYWAKWVVEINVI